MTNYSWLGPIIIKRVRDAIVLNLRRQFLYDSLYPYVETVTFTTLPGVVDLINETPFVTGTGTKFLTTLKVGNRVQFGADTNYYYVSTISSDTNLALTTNYTGATTVGSTVSWASNVVVNFDCTRIAINDATPQDYYYLPSINVMTAAGEETRFLQEDFFEEFTDANGNQSERRGAPMSINVTIDAMALDVITRDQLVDRLYEKFKIITTDLAANGIGILKTSISPDSRKFENDRWYYTSSVTMHLYAEWLDEDITPPNTSLTGMGVDIYTPPPHGINQRFSLD
jgi:hypothetical protein